jgi:hypothetical protein
MLNRKDRRRAKKFKETIKFDNLWDTSVSPSIAAMVEKENLDTAIRPLVGEALRCLNGARFPSGLKPEQLSSLGCAMRLPVTDENGSSFDLAFMFDFANSKAVILFPHEGPGVFASMMSGDIEIFIPGLNEVRTFR